MSSHSRSNCFFGEAYNVSYTDVYDFASAGNNKSLKKLEIEMGNLTDEDLKKKGFSDEKIRIAVKRAKELMGDKNEKIPSNYGTYVYKIVEEILDVV